MRIFFMVLVILSIAGCKGSENKKANQSTDVQDNTSATKTESSFLFGKICSHCIENCSHIYQLTWNAGKKAVLAKDQGHHFSRDTVHQFAVVENEDLVQLAEEIRRRVPKIFYTSADSLQTYGCPDCYDQCGFYLEFDQENARKKIRIDAVPTSLEDEVKTFAILLDSTLQKMRRSE